MKVVYMSVNSSYSHSSPVYGQLRSLAERDSSLKNEWILKETTINDNHDKLISEIIALDPTLVCSTGYLFNIDTITKLFHKLGSLLSNACFVLGGSEFLGDNESFLRKNSEVSAVFRGDESSFSDFLGVVFKRSNWRTIKGLCYLDDNRQYVDNGTAMIHSKNLDELPSPYKSGYFPEGATYIHFETSRGCPFSCSFCTSSLSEGVSFYSINRVESDLKFIQLSGIKEIRVLDRTFNYPEDRCLALLDLLQTKFSEMNFHLEINPSILSCKVIDKINSFRVGQLHLEVGIQTFEKEALDLVDRGRNLLALENIKKILSTGKTCIHCDLISGMPNQTLESIFNDVKVLVKSEVSEIQVEVLKVLPGTSLACNNSLFYSKVPPYEVLQSNRMSFDELRFTKVLSRVIDCYYNVESLKKLFILAVKVDELFFLRFIRDYESYFTQNDKPSLKAKLILFFEYAERYESKEIKDCTSLFAILNGCFLEQISCDWKKVNKIKNSLFINKTVEVSKFDKSTLENSVYISFEYNAVEIFLENSEERLTGSFEYLICYNNGCKNSGISQIVKLTHT